MAERHIGIVRASQDPFALLRQMTSELDRAFEDFSSSRWSAFPLRESSTEAWLPRIEVFQKDHRLITRVDLPGLKKEDVNVEVSDGQLLLSGERKRDTEDTSDDVYRSECEYGSFFRAVPLPRGVKADDVKASFASGVLEVSVPIPEKKPESKATKVQIDDGEKDRMIGQTPLTQL